MRALSTVMLVVFLSACASSPKDEASQLEDLRHSSLYKTYLRVSVEAMKPVVKEYNEKLVEQGKAANGESQVHSLLGLIWVSSLQAKLAILEADYAAEQAKDPHDRYMALALLAIGLHEEGWHHLAKQRSAEANTLIQANGFTNRYVNGLVLIHLAGGALALQEGNFSHTITAIREIGVLMNKEWLVGLGDSSQLAYQGARDKAIDKLRELKDRPDLSPKEREGISKALEAAVSGGSDYKTALLKAAFATTMYVGIEQHPSTRAALEKIPSKYRDKLSGLFK